MFFNLVLLVTSMFDLFRPHSAQPPTKKGSYSQVGFSYDDDRKGDSHLLESDEDNYDGGDGDDDEKDSSGVESNDEEMNVIAKDFGIKRFSWLMYMDKKAKEEEKHQKEVIKGDPYIVSTFSDFDKHFVVIVN